MLLNKRISIFTFLKQIKFDITAILIYAIVVGISDQYGFLSKIEIPIAMSAIIGTALSLLLAFKSNQAYDRWWEARIVWGSIVNESRTLMRQMITFYKDPEFSTEASNFKEKFAKRQIAWCYSLGQSLRNEDAIKPIKKLLSEEELRFVKNHKHIPNALLVLHARLIQASRTL